MIDDGGQHLGTQVTDADSVRRLQRLPQEARQQRLPNSSAATERLASLIEAALLHWDSDGAEAKQLVTEAYTVLRPALAAVARPSRRAAPMPRVGLVRWKAAKAIAYMEANLGSKLDIGKLADLLALSKSHFCRAFKCSLGVSPMVFLNLKRIARARELLATTDQRLSEIAVVCG
ncbi:MAG: AraC family transcriptional regulator, partial [Pseudolabrys sp.]